MMDGFRDKERKGVERERERQREIGIDASGWPQKIVVHSLFQFIAGAPFSKGPGMTLSPNEGARQLLDMLGSH